MPGTSPIPSAAGSSASAPTAGYRLSKFARRNRVALATTAVVTVSLLTATFLRLTQARRANHEAVGAARQRAVATNEAARALGFASESDRARIKAESGAYADRVLLASQRMEAGDLDQAGGPEDARAHLSLLHTGRPAR